MKSLHLRLRLLRDSADAAAAAAGYYYMICCRDVAMLTEQQLPLRLRASAAAAAAYAFLPARTRMLMPLFRRDIAYYQRGQRFAATRCCYARQPLLLLLIFHCPMPTLACLSFDYVTLPPAARFA